MSMRRAITLAMLSFAPCAIGCGGSTSDETSDAGARTDAPFEVSAACLSCVESCQDELNACVADSACTKLTTCINDCKGAATCVTDCQSAHPSAKFDAYVSCIGGCGSACR